jgi:hypothetical protein
MTAIAAAEIIASETALRARFKEAGRLARLKQLDHLDTNCRRFIALSPFCCLATVGADGRVDNSPRGDQPGFVEIANATTLIIPDRPGNNRLDSMANIVANPNVGLLFFIPGVTETLRVNGQARIATDPALLARFAVGGRAPTVVVVVAVQEAFLHCSKALIRSRLWQADAQIDRKALPSLGRMIADIVDRNASQATVAEYDEHIERNIKDELY